MLPAFTYGQREAASSGHLTLTEKRSEASLTAKYGLTSDLILESTVNPDFSQVESDAGQVDVNLRYALVYPEKRPFFLEGSENFTVGGTNSFNADPDQAIVYTRTIVDPLVGIKLTGKFGESNSIAATQGQTAGNVDLTLPSRVRVTYAALEIPLPVSVSLTVQDATQGQTADNVSLTQDHALTVDNATQNQTAGNVTLTQNHALTVDNAIQAQTAGNVSLTQQHNITVANAAQGQTAGNVTLTQVHALTVDNATQTQTAGNVELDIAGRITIQGATQPQTADNVTLTQVISSRCRTQRSCSITTDELHKPIPKPALEVKQILHRDKPILWATGQGRPVTDMHMLLAFTRTATLWTELEKMKIPGIQTVCLLPESAGRFWAVVSVKQAYPAHSRQVADAVIASNTGSYGITGVITVDDDIAADDLQRVIWALSCRYDPMRGTELMKRGRSTPLDPALDPESDKLTTSRILMDACIPYEWKQKPVEARLDDATLAAIKARWREFGLT